MDGIININKPKGITSHTVVSKVRRILNMKRVGHTGTLDPDAEGVLPICVGKGTKASDMLIDSDKQYRAVLKLGITTDTQDATGDIVNKCEVCVTEDQIIQTVNAFIGEIMQLPPMYSAVKKDGKKLYQLARAGIEVERTPRKIHIYNILIEAIQGDCVTLLIDCSKGTYIRTLCHDIGQKLGCGGIMYSLVRTRAGIFHLENSVTLEQLEQGEYTLLTLNELFRCYDEFVVNKQLEEKVRNGVPIRTQLCPGRYRVVNSMNELLCLSDYQDGTLKMYKSFWG